MGKIGVIIKNNLKLIARNRVLILAVIAGVVLVIASLSNVFHDLLGQAEKAGHFTVGYQVSEKSAYKAYEDMLISSLEDEGISCRKYVGEQPEEIIKGGEAAVFVDFSDNGYHIYGGSDSEIQTRTIQYVLFAADENMRAMMTGQPKTEIETSSLPHIKTAEADDYYSIVELTYFICLGAVFISMIMHEERKNRISMRFRVGGIGRVGLYFGKLIPCVISAIVIIVIISGTIVTVLFDVSWGNIPVAFGLMSLQALAFITLGMVLFLLFDNVVVAIGALFMQVFFMGLVGGTFESYMYSSFSEEVKRLSPLYHVNRTLCEYSVSGHSDYLLSAVLYLTAITVVSVLLGILLTGRKER